MVLFSCLVRLKLPYGFLLYTLMGEIQAVKGLILRNQSAFRERMPSFYQAGAFANVSPSPASVTLSSKLLRRMQIIRSPGKVHLQAFYKRRHEVMRRDINSEGGFYGDELHQFQKEAMRLLVLEDARLMCSMNTAIN